MREHKEHKNRLHLTNVGLFLACILFDCYHWFHTVLFIFSGAVANQHSPEWQPVDTLRKQCEDLRKHLTECKRRTKYSITSRYYIVGELG